MGVRNVSLHLCEIHSFFKQGGSQCRFVLPVRKRGSKLYFIVKIKHLSSIPQRRHFSIGRWLCAGGKNPCFICNLSFVCSCWDHPEPQASPHVMLKSIKETPFHRESINSNQTNPSKQSSKQSRIWASYETAFSLSHHIRVIFIFFSGFSQMYCDILLLSTLVTLSFCGWL